MFIVVINNTKVTAYTHKVLFSILYDNICHIKNILLNGYRLYSLCSFLILSMLMPAVYFQSGHVHPFSNLPIREHLFILFDSVMPMFDVASLISSGFKHTVSFQTVVCTVHGCPTTCTRILTCFVGDHQNMSEYSMTV